MALWSNGARVRLQGGGLKPQLDTARQRLLAPEHCTGRGRRTPPLGSGAMEPVMARKMWRTLEPYHGLIYFAPEATAAYEALGVMGFDGYFASRAAPMGAVPAEVVVATFFNFNPADRPPRHPRGVGRHHAGGAARGAARRGRRTPCGEPPATSSTTRRCARAAELARTAADGVHRRRSSALRRPRRRCRGPTSRALALWHAITLLREFRGDGHIACLVEAGLDGHRRARRSTPRPARCRAPRSRARASGTTPPGTASVGEPRRRGASSTATAPSPRPAPPCASTSRTAPTPSPWPPWEALGEEGCDELRSLVRPLSKADRGGRHLRAPRR